MNCLLLEDDKLTRFGLCSILKENGLNVLEAATIDEAKNILDQVDIELAFSDLDVNDKLSGLKFLPELIKKNIYTVIISGHDEDEIVCNAYLEGANDYLTKPYSKQTLQRILQKFKMQKKGDLFEEIISKTFLTKDPGLLYELNVLQEVILSSRPVMILGETGTGKTLLAKLIHKIKFGHENNFVHLNCSELPENLLESELFGYEKGAFTGAEKYKKGKIEQANEGTLFLDEVATMPLSLQQKLLKAIEEKTFYPVGSEKPVYSNFSVISATCENLDEYIKNGKFRLDLFFRLDGHRIILPSLRERRNDIPNLIKHFLKKGDRRVILDAESMQLLENYDWPGNIRELEKVIDILRSKTMGVIRVEDLPTYLIGKKSENTDEQLIENLTQKVKELGLKEVLRELESSIAKNILQENDGKVRQTLKDLKISSSSFYNIVNKL